MNVTRYLLLGALLPFSLLAQDIPDGVVGTAYSYNFGEGFEELPAGSSEGFEFGFSFAVASGTVPPGLTLASNGLLSGVPIVSGQFPVTIRLTFIIKIDGQDFCAILGPDVCVATFPVSIRITGQAGAPFIIFPDGLSFSSNGPPPPAQSITLSNRTSTPRGYTSQVTYSNGANWLTLSAGTGSVPAFSNGEITLGASATGLPPGVYRARIVVTPSAGDAVTVSITLTVTSNQPAIVLSQNGLFFAAVQGGSGVPAQSVAVQSSSGGAIPFTATPVTFSGGSGWLATSSTAGNLEVRVTPGTLGPGDYYGQVTVAAQGVTNSPQSISVVMHVDPSTAIGVSVKPNGMIFVGRPGGSNPAAQQITIANFGRAPLRAGGAANFLGGRTFFTLAPSTVTVNPGASATIGVTPNITGLAAGVYRAEIVLVVEGLVETLNRVDVLLIVAPGAGPAASKQTSRNEATGCTPTKLIPLFSALGSGFKVSTGWPTPIEVRVVDDCGDPLPTTGTVTAAFSNGDPALALKGLADGRWTGTWQARASTAGVVVTAAAALQTPKLVGSAQIGGSATANPNVPVIAAGGVLSAASFEKQAPIAPGGFVALFGSKVGGALTVAPQLPLTTTLDGIQVIIAGQPMPLYFSSEGQINAIVPYGIPANTTQQVVVRKGNTISVPETVNVAAAQPALFTINQTGLGTGIIVAIRGDRSWVVSATDRVRPGDVLVMYCTGLGAVKGDVVAGTAAPAVPLPETTNSVAVKIGGRDAAVAYAGLTPGFAGLYQINVTVPVDVPSGASVDVIITVGGQSSPAGATIAVE